MKQLMENLFKLQTLEFDDTARERQTIQINELRGKIPAPILGHYDRLRARGKKGVAAVMTIKHGHDIQLCDTCGRYLYLPAEEETPAPPPPKVAKSGRKKSRAVLLI